MTKIVGVEAVEVLDSRGFPTVQVTLIGEKGLKGKAVVPSGASKGEHEALELRDEDKKRYFGKGVKKVIENILGPLKKVLLEESALNQVKIDHLLIERDGTENKSKYGANAILGLSLAAAKLGANSLQMPLYRYIGGCQPFLLPCPMMNIINGGLHGDSGIEFQEFMIRPHGAPSFSEALRQGVEVFQALKGILKKRGFSTGVGDEGGFVPKLDSNEEAIELILEAIQGAGFKPKDEISLALDCAASTFYSNGFYSERSSQEQIDYLASLVEKYPIDSIEDGMDQNDWEGWKRLNSRIGKKVQLVGDDLFVTNTKFLQKGIREKAANAILIKPNQIGTLTETLECIELAKVHGIATIISHRSGDTEDTAIADISVALRTGQIKTGSLCRQERIAKYNRLLTIENELSPYIPFRDSNYCRHHGRCL